MMVEYSCRRRGGNVRPKVVFPSIRLACVIRFASPLSVATTQKQQMIINNRRHATPPTTNSFTSKAKQSINQKRSMITGPRPVLMALAWVVRTLPSTYGFSSSAKRAFHRTPPSLDYTSTAV